MDNTSNGTVLLTGSAGRIGLELARECLDMGYRVIIHYRSSPEPAASLFKDDGRVAFVCAELGGAGSMEGFFADVTGAVDKTSARLTGLINNAAVFERGDMGDVNHFNNMLTNNALAPMRIAAKFAEIAESGWIVNITDARVLQINKNYQNYRVSKLLLEEITRQQAFLYAPRIRVNAIAPGVILPDRCDMGDDHDNCDDHNNIPPNKYDISDELKKSIPLNKVGNMKNIRQALRFLVENDYVTGSVIPVDGGRHL